MDQDASAEMDELEAGYRLLDEKRRRLQAEKEERLQQLIRTYEIDRKAGQKDIDKKELALKELEAKYNEELRIKKEALRTALQRDSDRKRKHDAEVEHVNQLISGLKRLKHSNLELPVRPVSCRSELVRGLTLFLRSCIQFPCVMTYLFHLPNLNSGPEWAEGVVISRNRSCFRHVFSDGGSVRPSLGG